MILKTVKRCRVCGSRHLIPILSLGNQYVTNFLDSPKAKSYKAPLDLVLCDTKKGGCGLLQLKHTFNHDILYRKYWFRSGISTTLVKALADVVNKAERVVDLESGDLVIDIGSNDGTLLKQYKGKNITRVGFEPSNLWKFASGRNLVSIHDYFNYGSFSRRFKGRKAKIITSIAMFYDLDDPNKFVEDITRCLDDNGLWIIQMNYLYLMLKDNTFDNISHEHLEYYSLLSLEKLLGRHGLEVMDVELNEVNGGSFRIYIRKKGADVKPLVGAEGRVLRLKALEKRAGMDTIRPYLSFARRIKMIGTSLHSFLEKQKRMGKSVFIYGASTRGLVILQFARITNRLIIAATDKNPEKWGKYIVGTGIPIISIDEYRRRKPDYLFILPYHLNKEIRSQESRFLNKNGKMIVPIPKFKIYG